MASDLQKLQASLASRVQNKVLTNLRLNEYTVTPPTGNTIYPNPVVKEIDVLKLWQEKATRELIDRQSLGMPEAILEVMVPRTVENNYGLYPAGTWTIQHRHWGAPASANVIHQRLENDACYKITLAILKTAPAEWTL